MENSRRLTLPPSGGSVNFDNCYNVFSIKPREVTPVSIQGTVYESVRGACRILNISRGTLRRYLRDPSRTDFFYLKENRVSYGKIPIFAKKVYTPSILFESYRECIEAGFEKNNQNIRKKIERGEPGWRYAHVDANNKPLRIPYLPKAGERTYKQWRINNGL